MSATYPHRRDRELAHREADGIEVVLLWNAYANRVRVSVSDDSSGTSFDLEPEPRQALDAFYHPYWYAAVSGVPYDGDLAHA